jgi:type II secretory pathway component PulK
MGLKVADVFSTVNTKKNVFYSAYLKNKVQYNDVDPDKVEELPDSLMETIDKPESAESSNKSEPSEVTPFKDSETSAAAISARLPTIGLDDLLRLPI